MFAKMYKCLMCGRLTYGGLLPCPISEEESRAQLRQMLAQRNIDMRTHLCQDGSLGLQVFAGFQKDEALKKK